MKQKVIQQEIIEIDKALLWIKARLNEKFENLAIIKNEINALKSVSYKLQNSKNEFNSKL